MEYVIKTNSIGGMTEEQFYDFCQENDSLKLERNVNGEIIIMPPTGSESSFFNAALIGEVSFWNKRKKLGYVFDSNGGFTLPNHAVRSPDVSFIKKERWKHISPEDRKRFSHICPDFVIELRSPSDDSPFLDAKMQEYISNGCALAWLIDPQQQQTTIYRSDKSVQVVSFEIELNGEDILPGFSIDLREVFYPEI